MKTIATSVLVFALAATVAQAQLQPSAAGFKIRRFPTFSPQRIGTAKQHAIGTSQSRQKPPRIIQYRPGTFPIRPLPATRTFPTTVRALVYFAEAGAPETAGTLVVTVYDVQDVPPNAVGRKIQTRRIPVRAGEHKTWSVVFSGLPSGRDLKVEAFLQSARSVSSGSADDSVQGWSKQFSLWPQASATVTVPMYVRPLTK